MTQDIELPHEPESQDDAPNEDGPSPFSLRSHDPAPGHPSPGFNPQAYDAIDTSEAARLDRLAQRLQGFKSQSIRRTYHRTPRSKIPPGVYDGMVARTALTGPDSNMNYQAWIKLLDHDITMLLNLNPSGRRIQEFLEALGLTFDELDLKSPLNRECRVQVKHVNRPPPVYKIEAVLPPLPNAQLTLPLPGEQAESEQS
jgi:hypothetical protein